jgi:DNA polymerase III sliding clamp (beta) subunit (PCNA family)
MKTTLNAKAVKPAVKFVTGIIGRRNTLPILSNVLCYANGHFEMEATDLDVTLQASCEGQSAIEGRTTIPGRALLDASGGKESFELETDDKNFSTFRAGGNVRSVNGLPADEFPVIDPMPANARKVQFPADVFMAALKSVSGAMSTDENRYILNGVCVEIGAGVTKLIATDGRRLHLAEIAGGNVDPETLAKIEVARVASNDAQNAFTTATAERVNAENTFPPKYVEIPAGAAVYKHVVDGTRLFEGIVGPEVTAAMAAEKAAEALAESLKKTFLELSGAAVVLIPAAAVKHILRIPWQPGKGRPAPMLTLASWVVETRSKQEGEEKVFAVTPFARIDCGAFVVISKQIEGNYPNYRQVIPVECKERIMVNVAEFAAAVRVAEKATSDKANSVKFTFTKNMVRVSGCSPEIGEAHADMAINYAGKEFAIAFNPGYVLDACEAFSGTDCMGLEFVDELCPVRIVNAMGLSAVIMPMRLS